MTRKAKKTLTSNLNKKSKWFNSLPILKKIMTVLLTLDVLVLIGFVVTELYIEGDEAGELLTDQAQAELATLERIYNYGIKESGLVSEATANNLAIINVAQNYNNQEQINPSSQKQVNQILLENEGNTESAKKTFLVSKDLKIIADSDSEQIGQNFEPETLINSILSNPQQIITNRIISGKKLQQKFPELTSLVDTEAVITQYTFTPVITLDTEEIEAVLVSIKLLTGEESVLEQSLVTIGGGYHAVYLQKQSGEFSLVTSLLDLESHEFGQHHLHDEQYHLPNFPLPNTLILQAATQVKDETIIQRMLLKKNQYTVAAKMLTDTLDGSKVILVRGTPENEVLNLIGNAKKREISVFIIILVLTFILCIFLAKIIVRPIKDLQETAKQFAQGNLYARAKYTGNDEIGQLAFLFNKMADSIGESFSQEVENTRTQIHLNKQLKEQIEERKKAESKLKLSLREKETLLKEIHHRVKNNLLVVSNLLEFQTDYFEDEKLIQALEDSRNRIFSMALIHEQLYRSTDLHRINFKTYLEQLVEVLLDSHNIDDNIQFHLNIKPIFLNVETAHPCGLIVNELISNVFKHAFPDGRSGQVWIGFHQKHCGELILSVQDNGIGIPNNLEDFQGNSLGMELIYTLTEQLEGQFEIKHNKGTLFIMKFHELHYRSRLSI